MVKSKVTVKWDDELIPFGKVKDWKNKCLDEKCSLYMIMSGTINENNTIEDLQLHYIGKTTKTPRERIIGKHPAYKKLTPYMQSNPERVFFVQVGVLTPHTQESITTALLRDVENAIIYDTFNFNPDIDPDYMFNVSATKNYGNRVLEINNDGNFKPLFELIDTETFPEYDYCCNYEYDDDNDYKDIDGDDSYHGDDDYDDDMEDFFDSF